MIKLVAIDIDRALGTRDGRILDGETVEDLRRILRSGYHLCPMSARGRKEAVTLLGGDESLVQDAVLCDGAELVAEGRPLLGLSTEGESPSRLDGLMAVMDRLGVGPDEAVVLGGATADAATLAALPNTLATSDSSTKARDAAKKVVKSRAEGGIRAFADELERAAEWGEAPSFVHEAPGDSGVRAEFGETVDTTEPKSGHPFLTSLLGVVILACGVFLYLSDTFPSIARMMILTVALLVGVAVFYLGIAQGRDRRKARRVRRRAEREAAKDEGKGAAHGR